MLAIFLAAWLLLSALSGLWALATPIAAAPDEPAHMVKAASVALGEFTGEFGPDGTEVDVPQYIAWTHAQTCTANNDEVTADCAPPVPGAPDRIVGSATTAGLYNPLYYLLVGWPTLLDGDSSGVYAMRLVSAVIASAFLALTVMMVSTWRHRALPLLALAAIATPMVVFLNGTVNPNSVEITATLATFTAVLGVVVSPQRSLLTQRALIAAVAGAVAANMRGLSPLWVAVAVLAPFVLASRSTIAELAKSAQIRIAALVIVAAAAFGAIWVLTSNSLAAHVDPATSATEVPYFGASPITGFFLMIAQLGNQMREMVGVFGWMDTSAPAEAYIGWTLLIGGLLVFALVFTRRRRLLFVSVLAAAFVILPALAQAAFIRGGGFIWQGRYSLPLLVILLLGCSAMLAAQYDAVSARTRRILEVATWIAWGALSTYTFAAVLKRYVVGIDGSWPDIVAAPHWSPPGGSIVLILATAVVAAATSVFAYRLGHDSDRFGVAHALAEDTVGKSA